MNDTATELAETRARLARTETELEAHRAAMTPHPFQNTTVTRQQLEREWAEKSARVQAAMQAGQEREAAAAAEREAAIMAEGRQRLADYEGRCHQHHLHNGGSEGDWPSVWRELKQRWLVEQSAVDPRERRIQEKVEKLRADPAYARF